MTLGRTDGRTRWGERVLRGCRHDSWRCPWCARTASGGWDGRSQTARPSTTAPRPRWSPSAAATGACQRTFPGREGLKSLGLRHATRPTLNDYTGTPTPWLILNPRGPWSIGVKYVSMRRVGWYHRSISRAIAVPCCLLSPLLSAWNVRGSNQWLMSSPPFSRRGCHPTHAPVIITLLHQPTLHFIFSNHSTSASSRSSSSSMDNFLHIVPAAPLWYRTVCLVDRAREGGRQGGDIVSPVADGDPAVGGGAVRPHFRCGVPSAAMLNPHLLVTAPPTLKNWSRAFLSLTTRIMSLPTCWLAFLYFVCSLSAGLQSSLSILPYLSQYCCVSC